MNTDELEHFEHFPGRIADICELLATVLHENDICWPDSMAAAAMLAAYLCCIQSGADRANTRNWFVSVLDLALAQSPPQSTHELAKMRLQ